ncbi:MAG: prepilin-type N-terminal cleavage/methylation domain-containing protein [Planctomycetes bacterium]|nr:prepilin-type N-terminal cleavage/methylation domain-containing protein [Planctomycetota bacterium]
MNAAVRFLKPLSSGSGRGFTMIELLVVISIIVLAMSLMIGGLSDLNQRRRLSAAAETVTSAIALARSTAISERAVVHVRIENKGANAQYVGVYRFPKTSDALRATTDAEVVLMGGWNESSDTALLTNYRVSVSQLPANTWFETEYDPAQVWDGTRDRFQPLSVIHPAPDTTLYYKDTNDVTLLPRVIPNYSAYAAKAHQLIYFYPDGSASANVLLFIRNEWSLAYVQVWKGGMIRSGTVRNVADFANLD